MVIIGMWLERYLIVISGLCYDLISGQTFPYTPSLVDFSLIFGSLGLLIFGFYFISQWIEMLPENAELINE